MLAWLGSLGAPCIALLAQWSYQPPRSVPHPRFRIAASLLFLVPTYVAESCWALDKQGSAHSGQLAGEDSGFELSGSTLLGAALYNPSYAARPDNSGRALMRVAQHLDIDLIGERLDIPIDLNLFTDRTLSGLNRFRPSEFDVIAGLASTWPLGEALAVEFGARGERDMPLDRAGLVQQYIDTRLRLIYSLHHVWPTLWNALAGGDVSGAWTLGWFALNPSYAARPDNSGLALLRFGDYTEVSTLGGRLAFGCSTTLFTDRRTAWLRPSELDLVPEVITRFGKFEVHLAYERDMPVDRSGLVQSLVLAHLLWNFSLFDADTQRQEHESIHERGGVEKGGGSN
jgi:hypothetical protein